MPWLALDLVLALAALVLLTVCGLRLWRAVRSLGRTVGEAGERLGAAVDELEARQAELSRADASSGQASRPV